MTNQYIGVYKCTRDMHARPLTEVAEEIQRIDAQYSCLDFEVTDTSSLGWLPPMKRTANCRSVLGMIMKNIGYGGHGQPLEIKVIGDYSTEQLKECADRIGILFRSEAERD